MAQKVGRKARFLKEHPLCCFCGGTRPATTVDHVPPKACFPPGLCPENLEFPSCNLCNNGTLKQDTIFGFYSMLVDFNQCNHTSADRKQLEKLRHEISMRYPDALPDLETRELIYQVGHIITPSPIAISVSAAPVVKDAMKTIGEKLAHALYYREMKRIMNSDHEFFASIYQIQRDHFESLTAYFKRVLPDLRIGQRSNIKEYGSRFAYMSGCKEDEDFFVFAAQFGHGLVCWGIVLGRGLKLNKPEGALQKMNWLSGGCGLGSQVELSGLDEHVKLHCSS